MIYGHALKAITPFSGTRGTLLTWQKGTTDFTRTLKEDDQQMKLKDIHQARWESLCFIYFYYYPTPAEEIVQPPTTPITANLPNTTTAASQPPTTTNADEPPARMDQDWVIPQLPLKREEPPLHSQPSTPTSKRLKIEGNFTTISTGYQNAHTMHWLLDRRRQQRLHNQQFWADCYEVPRWFSQMTMDMIIAKSMSEHADVQVQQGQPLVHQYSSRLRHFHLDLKGGCFMSVTAEDNIAEKDLPHIWPMVEEADAKEVAQFVQEKAFEKILLSEVPEGTVIVDGAWVRRWKNKLNKRIVKSRMCARGCFDPQKDILATRSTTASRLSQRLLVSTAAVMQEDPESWDVSGAFLKGLTFDRIRAILLKQGIKTPVRAVVLLPPWNVWRHLAAVDPQFHLEPWEIPLYGLWCLKPIYGLNDAPVAWQLSLGQFLQRQGGHHSKLDDSFYAWKNPKQSPALQGVLTTHVDDLAIVGNKPFMNKLYKAMCNEFGQISRDSLPFTHCGCQYSKTKTGLKIDQAAFAERLKPSDNPPGDDERDLTPAELTQFRSVLGGLLWMCSTRLDIIAEVGTLQSVVTKSKVKHLRQANQLVKKACSKDKLELGLHYRYFDKNTKYRIQCIHDASSASQGRNYAQEGIMVLLMPELPRHIIDQDEMTCSTSDVQKLCNYGHLLYAHGGKAKRISYSTSHAETLSAIGGVEASSMVSVRLTELWIAVENPSLQTLTAYQEQGSRLFPVDSATDCRDLFELCTGSRAVPQDKLQRFYILAIKEARATGRLRFFILTPTEYMLADGLTKSMTALKLLQFLSTGYVEFGNKEKHATQLRRLPILENFEEEDLFKDDQTIWKEATTKQKSMTVHGMTLMTCLGLTKRHLAAMIAFSAMLPTSAALGSDNKEEKENNFFFYVLLILAYAGIRMIELCITRAMQWLTTTTQKSSSSKRMSKSKKSSTSESMPSSPSSSSEPKRVPQKRLNLEDDGNLRARVITRPPEQIWLTNGGERYHLSRECQHMKAAIYGARKLTLCKTCDRTQSSSGV